MSYVIAIAGATGSVGREILNILDERKFPVARIDVLASRRSLGREVSFGDKTLKIKALEHYDFAQADKDRSESACRFADPAGGAQCDARCGAAVRIAARPVEDTAKTARFF